MVSAFHEYLAFTDSMNTQKTYISEMEEQLRDKDDENQNILLKAQDHVKNFMDDSLESIQVIYYSIRNSITRIN